MRMEIHTSHIGGETGGEKRAPTAVAVILLVVATILSALFPLLHRRRRLLLLRLVKFSGDTNGCFFLVPETRRIMSEEPSLSPLALTTVPECQLRRHDGHAAVVEKETG